MLLKFNLCTVRLHWPLRVVICMTLIYLAGCSRSTNDQISSATTKYEVADEQEQNGSQPIAQFQPLEDQMDEEFSGGKSETPQHSAEVVAFNAPDTTSQNLSELPSREASTASIAVNEPGEVGGTPEELLQRISELEQRVANNQIGGTTRKEQTDEFHRLMHARKEAAEKILAQKHEREQGLVAAHAKLDSLNALASTEAPGVMQEFLEYAEVLAEHSDENLRTAGTLAKLEGLTQAMMMGDDNAADQLLTFVDLLVESDNEHVRYEAVQAKLMLLSQSVDINAEDAEQELTEFAESLFNDSNPKIAEAAHLILFSMQLRAMSIGQITDTTVVIDSLRNLLDVSEKNSNILDTSSMAVSVLIQKEYFEEAAQAGKIILEAFANNEDKQVAIHALRILSRLTSEMEYRDLPTAGQLYDQIDQAFANHKFADLADHVQQYIEMGRRRVGLIGKPLEITGTQHNGEAFDWSQYAGKVVLIDFWATWCGPCIAEIPNIKKNYELYREQGFEVVGINLDQDPVAAQKFIGSENIPWTNIVGGEEEGPNAIAQQCGVEGIPFVMLVGRDGNVAALHVRGDKMQPLIEAMLTQNDLGDKQSSTVDLSNNLISTSAVD